MKTLYLLRHAKSSWGDSDLTDFERPLNERGLQAAPLMGETMRKKEFLPEIIVSSPARRARQTAEIVKASARIEGEIGFDKRIYEASVSNLLQVVSDLNNEKASALLVGHNPGFEGLAGVLTGKFQPMPTAALAVIDLEIESWSEVAPQCGTLREFLRPKELE